MKKMMSRIAAALLALTCLPVTGLTAAADVDWYWGSTAWSAAADLEPFDDRGMFVNFYAKAYLKDPDTIQVFLRTTSSVQPDIVIFARRKNYMRFVLRDNIDYEEGRQQVVEALNAYFPDMHLQRPWNVASDKVFELYLPELPENAADMEADILLALAKRHLISEFYGWGETADYQIGYYENPLLQSYSSYTLRYDEQEKKTVVTSVDWDAVQAYLDANHPGYTVEKYDTGETITHYDADGNAITEPDIRYRINGTDDLTAREKVELDCELGVEFGICTPCGFLETTSPSATGRNALEAPGDVTLDTEIDIMDVIALNKQLLGAETLCDTAKKNSDINADGTPDETDSLAILKYVVGITDGFAES